MALLPLILEVHGVNVLPHHTPVEAGVGTELALERLLPVMHRGHMLGQVGRVARFKAALVALVKGRRLLFLVVLESQVVPEAALLQPRVAEQAGDHGRGPVKVFRMVFHCVLGCVVAYAGSA